MNIVFIDFNELQEGLRYNCPNCLSIEGVKRKTLSIKSDYGQCFRCNTIFKPNSIKINLKQPILKDEITLDLSPWQSATTYCEEGLSYLNSRCSSIHYTSKDKFRFKDNKIFIPFYFNNNLIYYQIRYIKPKNGMGKYYNPPITNKPLFISYSWNYKLPIVIVEGVFDAIVLNKVGIDHNIVAILGSSMSNSQFKMLQSLHYNKEGCKIYLDSVELSKKLQKLLPNFSIIIPFDNGLDPEGIINKYGILKLKSLFNKYYLVKKVVKKYNNDIIVQPSKLVLKIDYNS